jgi:hypothetical protein
MKPLGAAAGASDRPPTTVWNAQVAATAAGARYDCHPASLRAALVHCHG